MPPQLNRQNEDGERKKLSVCIAPIDPFSIESRSKIREITQRIIEQQSAQPAETPPKQSSFIKGKQHQQLALIEKPKPLWSGNIYVPAHCLEEVRQALRPVVSAHGLSMSENREEITIVKDKKRDPLEPVRWNM